MELDIRVKVRPRASQCHEIDFWFQDFTNPFYFFKSIFLWNWFLLFFLISKKKSISFWNWFLKITKSWTVFYHLVLSLFNVIRCRTCPYQPSNFWDPLLDDNSGYWTLVVGWWYLQMTVPDYSSQTLAFSDTMWRGRKIGWESALEWNGGYIKRPLYRFL